MLYHIVSLRKNTFDACRNAVMDTYWPEKAYRKFKKELPESWQGSLSDEDKISRLEEILLGNNEDDKVSLVKEVCRNGLYKKFNAKGQSNNDASFYFPFIECFHSLFLKRKWIQPYNNPRDQADELFRLNKDENGNYSANVENYNHFVNVVSALARLIIYFRTADHIDQTFANQALKKLVFDDAPSQRTFKLMLAGFYHDIGKTVTDPRHAVEGAIILGYNTTLAQYQLHKIVSTYDINYRFEREDLLYVEALVLFHDHFGTLGTGEDGYMALVNVIDRIKRYSIKHDAVGMSGQMEWAHRYLFDLWLLNIADIMVSIKDKWKLQSQWEESKPAMEFIQSFLGSDEGTCRIHDLMIAFNLLDILGKKTHSDDLSTLEAEAYACSKRHIIERLRRLMKSALSVPLTKIIEASPTQLAEIERQKIAKQLRDLGNKDWYPIIVRTIQAVSDRDDFITRLSWIGKMDYALGFFQQLASGALNKVLQELKGEGHSGWLRSNREGIGYDLRLMSVNTTDGLVKKGHNLVIVALVSTNVHIRIFDANGERVVDKAENQLMSGETLEILKKQLNPLPDKSGLSPEQKQKIIRDATSIADHTQGIDDDDDYFCNVQAKFFADNFVATVIGILAYILFRERSIDRLRNIEFSDAKGRLTLSKIEQLLALEGPLRTRRAVEAIMQTIYFY